MHKRFDGPPVAGGDACRGEPPHRVGCLDESPASIGCPVQDDDGVPAFEGRVLEPVELVAEGPVVEGLVGGQPPEACPCGDEPPRGPDDGGDRADGGLDPVIGSNRDQPVCVVIALFLPGVDKDICNGLADDCAFQRVGDCKQVDKFRLRAAGGRPVHRLDCGGGEDQAVGVPLARNPVAGLLLHRLNAGQGRWGRLPLLGRAQAHRQNEKDEWGKDFDGCFHRVTSRDIQRASQTGTPFPAAGEQLLSGPPQYGCGAGSCA